MRRFRLPATLAGAFCLSVGGAALAQQAPAAVGRAQPAAAAEAGVGHAPLQAIGRFIGPDTVSVGHLRLDKLDLKATRNWANDLIKQSFPNGQAEQDELKRANEGMD